MGDVEPSPVWGRGALAVAGAILATLLLALLMFMVTSSNRAREEALASERHSYDVMLLTRTVDASLARAEAALGRYVLDEEQLTGSLYYSEWRLAERQIGELQRLVRREPGQIARVEEMKALYNQRGDELIRAAAAARAKQGSGGLSLFYGAGMTETGPKLRAKLAEIAAAERQDLRGRMAETRLSGTRANRLTEWLGWIVFLICAGAVVLGLFAFRAMSERIEALRAADSEADRAQRLEERVRERTQELTEANERLKAEAAERAAAEAQLRQVQKMEAVGQLTGGIAHDFNNMLAVIVGGLDLAKRKLRTSRREVEFHLDNAMEAQGQLAIRVENKRVAAGEVGELAGGDYVRISVADTGAGIPPEVMERVFEPFFTTKPVGKGTGLGLSQIFGFARQSGGDVTLDSTVGVGTTVSIYLPRSAETAHGGGEVHGGLLPGPQGGQSEAQAAATSILVVEDDPRVSRATVGALEELGYRPIACASGHEALDILKRENGIDLVITDVMMPEMTGPELVREVARRWPHIAVLFVTGYVGEAGDADELSGQEILRKPFTVSALAGAVASSLGRRTSEWPHAETASAAE
jgi:signal transduction histidine kinase/ActR/RegA family two-component response regulator